MGFLLPDASDGFGFNPSPDPASHPLPNISPNLAGLFSVGALDNNLAFHVSVLEKPNPHFMVNKLHCFPLF